MKLHRLVLANYRGVAWREIEFPDHGVVIVCGPNEVGKSSMIEALDLLLESKDRSTRKDVKAVKPTHVDVGAEVTAEISTGPYRFVYHKRFHKSSQTELAVLEPRREQLTGDEAHERVAAILAETVDTGLWRALRVLQAGSTDAVDLSGCDALSRALDAAAGDAATLTGTEPLLMTRIDAEFGRYYTPTGRATGEWAAAKTRLDAVEVELARCVAAVAEVDERVAHHGVLTEELAGLDDQRIVVDARHQAALTAAAQVATLTEQVRESRLVADAAAATSDASTAAHTERLRLCAELESRAATLAEAEARARDGAEAAAAAGEVAAAADAAAEQADQVLVAAVRRVEDARRVLNWLVDRDQADRLTSRLARIDTAQAELDRIRAELSAITLTAAMLRTIEDAATAVDRVEAQLTAVSATVYITAAREVDLVVEDQPVALAGGGSWSTTAPTEIDVPGVLTVRVSPGATALEIQSKHAAAQHEFVAALQTAGVADLAAARVIDQRRRELQSGCDQLSATLAGLCGDENPDQLRNRLAELRAGQPAEIDPTGIDTAAAGAELQAAEASHVQEASTCETHRKAAADVAARLTEKSTRAALLQDKVSGQQAELAAVTDRLTAQRAIVTDGALAATAATDNQKARAAELRAAEVSEKLAAAGPEAVQAELADAAAAADALRTRRDEVERALHEITVELGVFGTQGRRSQLDTAEADHQHATAEHARIERRARAVQLLASVMGRHRDATRLRYVLPFRTEIERLGRPVFGPDFEVEVDSQLCIVTRTLDGRTVPYESLSGGAKEQLGILVRLAGAALVAKEDTVPVLIDDALGFTDPDRLASMGEVFDAVGAHGQVIVLTCSPERYRSVEGAHRIELSV